MNSTISINYDVLNALIMDKRDNIKMVACDMDGTLLNNNHALSERTINAVRGVAASGVTVLLATGRMVEAIEEHLKMLGTSGIVVAHNGALIKDIFTKQVYHNDTVSMEIARYIIDIAQKEETAIHLNCDDGIYVQAINWYSEKFSKDLQIALNKLPSLEAQKKEPISILLMDNKPVLDEILHEILLHFEGSFDYVLIPWCEKVWQLQILPSNTSKGKGVLKAAEIIGVQSKQIMCFGDSYNDMEMITQAGIGIAMGNAVSELREKADFVTLTNDEDGVAAVLEVLMEQ